MKYIVHFVSRIKCGQSNLGVTMIVTGANAEHATKQARDDLHSWVGNKIHNFEHNETKEV